MPQPSLIGLQYSQSELESAFRAVAAGSVSPVSTGPLFPSLVACLTLSISAIAWRTLTQRPEAHRYTMLKLAGWRTVQHCSASLSTSFRSYHRRRNQGGTGGACPPSFQSVPCMFCPPNQKVFPTPLLTISLASFLRRVWLSADTDKQAGSESRHHWCTTQWAEWYLCKTLSFGLREASYWPKSGLRSNLIAPKFQNFPGGACPQTP